MSRVHAPELEPSVAWLNTPRALRMRELRGRVVVLDFFTSCCVNCMHVQPVLRALRERLAGEPVQFLGVHSGKFDAENEPERVRAAVRRYGIEHPVVVDREMALWSAFAVRSWPTLVCVRPDGTVAAVAPGEPDPALLEALVRSLLEEARAQGTLAEGPLALPREPEGPEGALLFPGKLAVAPDGRVAVSDSGHHRVLVLSPEGRVLYTVGSGLRGLRDGAFAECAFDDPQGLAWDGEALLVCDCRNHALRSVELAEGRVRTVAGTGEMAAVLPTASAPARETALRSPWDVLRWEGAWIVAMAGSHQLWRYRSEGETVEPCVGSGREAMVDGPALESALAQPSGLCALEGEVWLADSETSAVRAWAPASNTVRTLLGSGLFGWGDRDGPFADALLQHPLAVLALDARTLLVADTYNDALKALDLRTGTARTFYRGEGERSLGEPAGLALARDGTVLVADTNHHRVVRLDREGRWLGVLEVQGAPEPARGALPPARAASASGLRAVDWFGASLEPAEGSALRVGVGSVALEVRPPEGWKLTQDALRVGVEVSRRSDLLELGAPVTEVLGARATLSLEARVTPLPAERVPSEVLLVVDAVLCSEGPEGLCVPVRGHYRLPVVLAREGQRELRFAVTAPRPAV